jgi:hypothetical protein
VGYKPPVRRRWIRRSLWVLGFVCLWAPVLDDPPLVTGAYVQDVTAEAATIARIAAAPVDATLVVRGQDGAVVAERRSEAPRRRHAFRVDGLRPGTPYAFELVCGDGVREAGSLRTAPSGDEAPVRFVFLGDSGAQPWWVWLQRSPLWHLPARAGWLPDDGPVTAIGAAVAAASPEFVLHLGDVVYPKGQHAHYRTGFFGPFADVLRHAPIYAVLGNHDVMEAQGQQILANLHAPKNEVTGDGRCFSFAWGVVRLIGLDCNNDRTGDRYGPGHPSFDFLLSELATRTEPWVVVASHFPMRSASRQRDRADLLVDLLPVLEQHQVSLYLSGHDHCYQRFEHGVEGGEVPLVVSGGGGKNLYDVRPHPRATVLASEFHWCEAVAEGAKLVVRARALDGRQLDAFELALPRGERLERLRAGNEGRARRIERMLGK